MWRCSAKFLTGGEAGDNVGLLLRGIDKKDIRRGMVIAAPNSITPHTHFKGEVYILKKEEGGRHTPFHNKYRPQFYFRTTDVTGEITLEAGREMVMPGDNVTIEVNLIAPIAMDKGLRFAIREGGRTAGAGQVTEILRLRAGFRPSRTLRKKGPFGVPLPPSTGVAQLVE